MRVLTPIILATAAVLIAVTSAPAQTYDPNYPVCLQVNEDIANFYFDCSYTSMPQCQASASGRSASCVVNPYFAKPAAKSGRHQRPRRHVD